MQTSAPQVQQMLARAIAAHRAGDIAQAESLYELVLQADNGQFEALHLLGIIEGQRGNFAAGLRRISAALRIRPDSAAALVNLGRMQSELGDDAGALAAFDKALALNPRSARAHSALSNTLRRQHRLPEALAHCDAAVAIAPDYAGAWTNRGCVLFKLNRLEEALASFDHALAIKPGRAGAWFWRGSVLSMLGRRQEAYAAFAKAYEIKPDFAYVEGDRLHAKMHLCDWVNLQAECAHLAAGVRQGARRSNPFHMLTASASLADQRKCAEIWTAHVCRASAQPLWRGERYQHERIRLAYVSTDFRDHPVSVLAAGMFEAHDRSRFETTAVSLGPPLDVEMQRRLRRAFDHFLDVSTLSSPDIAKIVHAREIDIAVDLNGYTTGARTALFALRPAPIQVSYLGYPGTMAASYIDYLIADRTVAPADHADFYSERIAWLPDTFMAADAGRVIAERIPTRAECALPDGAFVFSCFNQSYKIAPSMFHIWMRLLQAVEHGVLWLSDLNAVAKANLRAEAERCGIAPERVIFAARIPSTADHLARQRQADLFLDTLPYNAHTTASDALWAGLPVLTCPGSTFAGRVAASLLNAVGLPELVTASLEDYEALALKIAREPALCASLKDRLVRNRGTFPLFDTGRFTRNIEAAYTMMWQLYQRGEPPRSFAVGPV